MWTFIWELLLCTRVAQKRMALNYFLKNWLCISSSDERHGQKIGLYGRQTSILSALFGHSRQRSPYQCYSDTVWCMATELMSFVRFSALLLIGFYDVVTFVKKFANHYFCSNSRIQKKWKLVFKNRTSSTRCVSPLRPHSAISRK